MRMVTKRKTRILFLCGSMNIGGSEKNVAAIAKQLDKEKYEPEVYCVFGGGPLEEQLRENHIRYETGSPGRIFDPKIFRRTYRFIRDGEYDILHCFGYPVIYLGVLLGAVVGIKVIVSIQALDTWKRWSDVMADRALKPFVDLYIADSEGARCFAIRQQGILPAKIMTIYDGVDTASLVPAVDSGALKRDLGIDPEATVVGVVGRLQDEHKGQSYFIKAIPSIVKDFPRTHFLVVGDGADRGYLEGLVDEMQVRERVTFAGTRTDLANIFSVIDILVLPSVQWESITKTMLEAMSMSRPVIATSVGDVGEIITHGETGMLIPPGEPDEIAGAVKHLLENPGRAAELGRHGAEHVHERSLTLEKSIRIVENAYEKVLSCGERRGGAAGIRAGLLFLLFNILSLAYRIYAGLLNIFGRERAGQ
ncbi:MAG: glycosyltransferase [Thermodesulfovibrionales bacterium]